MVHTDGEKLAQWGFVVEVKVTGCADGLDGRGRGEGIQENALILR